MVLFSILVRAWLVYFAWVIMIVCLYMGHQPEETRRDNRSKILKSRTERENPQNTHSFDLISHYGFTLLRSFLYFFSCLDVPCRLGPYGSDFSTAPTVLLLVYFYFDVLYLDFSLVPRPACRKGCLEFPTCY